MHFVSRAFTKCATTRRGGAVEGLSEAEGVSTGVAAGTATDAAADEVVGVATDVEEGRIVHAVEVAADAAEAAGAAAGAEDAAAAAGGDAWPFSNCSPLSA